MPSKATAAKQATPNRGAARNPQPLSAAQDPDALLKVPTVVHLVGLSESSLRRRIAAGTFPGFIKLGQRCTRFRASDVRAWLARQTTVVGG